MRALGTNTRSIGASHMAAGIGGRPRGVCRKGVVLWTSIWDVFRGGRFVSLAERMWIVRWQA